MKRILVIGGGMTGLAAAWRIQQNSQKSGTPIHLELLEASSHFGGSLKSASREGFLLEMGPDCFISEKPRGIGLCQELGLGEELMGTRPGKRRSFILRDGTFHAVPEGFYLLGPSKFRPFLKSRLLSWPGKIRAGLEPLVPARPQTDESLASFVRRRFGEEMLDWLAQPLVAGIYGASPDRLSLRATFPQFLEMERTYGSILLGLKMRRGSATRSASGARYSLFVTLRGGIQTLADTIVRILGTHVFRPDTRVLSISKPPLASSRHPRAGGDPSWPGTIDSRFRGNDDPWQIRLANDETLLADAVVLALPAHAAAELLRPLDEELASELAGIDYAPSATLNFAFREADVKRPLDGVGFVVPHKEKRLVLGCTFAHHKFDGRVPEGCALLRAFLGGVESARWTGEKDEPLTQKVLTELTEWLGIAGKPMFTHLERHGSALPQFSVGHLPRILRIEERLFAYRGLALAGNWQYGVGIPDCIESGERAADQLTAHLARQKPTVQI